VAMARASAWERAADEGSASETQGQCVAEALQKVDEMVLPVLPVLGLMLITGRGLYRAAWAAGWCTACRTYSRK
jgi:hypothetical protein